MLSTALDEYRMKVVARVLRKELVAPGALCFKLVLRLATVPAAPLAHDFLDLGRFRGWYLLLLLPLA